jgi:hypothetical protein
MTDQLTFTVDEVADAIGRLHIDPGNVEAQWMRHAASPCLAVWNNVNDAMRLIVDLHTHAGHANRLLDRLTAHPAVLYGIVIHWPTIRIVES